MFMRATIVRQWEHSLLFGKNRTPVAATLITQYVFILRFNLNYLIEISYQILRVKTQNDGLISISNQQRSLRLLINGQTMITIWLFQCSTAPQICFEPDRSSGCLISHHSTRNVGLGTSQDNYRRTAKYMGVWIYYSVNPNHVKVILQFQPR
jgi:hypothetical protein